jgi:hypothetical protein
MKRPVCISHADTFQIMCIFFEALQCYDTHYRNLVPFFSKYYVPRACDCVPTAKTIKAPSVVCNSQRLS